MKISKKYVRDILCSAVSFVALIASSSANAVPLPVLYTLPPSTASISTPGNPALCVTNGCTVHFSGLLSGGGMPTLQVDGPLTMGVPSGSPPAATVSGTLYARDALNGDRLKVSVTGSTSVDSPYSYKVAWRIEGVSGIYCGATGSGTSAGGGLFPVTANVPAPMTAFTAIGLMEMGNPALCARGDYQQRCIVMGKC